jgi:molybdopterin-biosynthesis enzyme MoeA-like protein
MRQWLAALLLVAGAIGTGVLWNLGRQRSVEDAAVNARIDARLHQVLTQMLEERRAMGELPPGATMAARPRR